MHFENNWEKKLIDKARQVVESGWGRIEMCVTNKGKRKSYAQTFTDVDDEKHLQSFKKGI